MDKDNFPPSPPLLSTTLTKPAGDLSTQPLLTGYRRPHCFSLMSVRNITPARKWLSVPPSRLVGPAPLSCIVRSFCFVVLSRPATRGAAFHGVMFHFNHTTSHLSQLPLFILQSVSVRQPSGYSDLRRITREASDQQQREGIFCSLSTA